MNKIAPLKMSQHSKPVAEFMEITPAQAELWLSKQHDKQRYISVSMKNKFIRDMQSKDGWILNGQPIIIDKDGYCLDGQHRLQACIDAEVSFQSLVAFGIENNAFPTIDIGLKRSLAQILKMSGYKTANSLGAGLTKAYAYDNMRLVDRSGASNYELLEYLDNNPLLIEAMTATRTKKGPITSSLACLIMYNIRPIDPELAAQYFEVLRHGAEQLSLDGKGSRWFALDALRKQCLENAGMGVHMRIKDLASALIVAWNHAYQENSGPARRWIDIKLPEFAGAKSK